MRYGASREMWRKTLHVSGLDGEALFEPRRDHPAAAPYPTVVAMVFEIRLISAVVRLPKVVTEVTITTKIRPQIRPYSMAVAPVSSRQNPVRDSRAARPPAARRPGAWGSRSWRLA